MLNSEAFSESPEAPRKEVPSTLEDSAFQLALKWSRGAVRLYFCVTQTDTGDWDVVIRQGNGKAATYNSLSDKVTEEEHRNSSKWRFLSPAIVIGVIAEEATSLETLTSLSTRYRDWLAQQEAAQITTSTQTKVIAVQGLMRGAMRQSQHEEDQASFLKQAIATLVATVPSEKRTLAAAMREIITIVNDTNPLTCGLAKEEIWRSTACETLLCLSNSGIEPHTLLSLATIRTEQSLTRELSRALRNAITGEDPSLAVLNEIHPNQAQNIAEAYMARVLKSYAQSPDRAQSKAEALFRNLKESNNLISTSKVLSLARAVLGKNVSGKLGSITEFSSAGTAFLHLLSLTQTNAQQFEEDFVHAEIINTLEIIGVEAHLGQRQLTLADLLVLLPDKTAPEVTSLHERYLRGDAVSEVEAWIRRRKRANALGVGGVKRHGIKRPGWGKLS